jgi:hypothetical protein
MAILTARNVLPEAFSGVLIAHRGVYFKLSKIEIFYLNLVSKQII